MITIKHYIKDQDQFVPIEEFKGNVPDPNYIDSAMEMTINGVSIMTCAEWDYIDDLWGYITNGFNELAEKKEDYLEWKTYFPDQPIELMFKITKSQNHIEILSTPSRGRIFAEAELEEFLTTISKAGQEFLLRMSAIVPEAKDNYEEEACALVESIENFRHSTNRKNDTDYGSFTS